MLVNMENKDPLSNMVNNMVDDDLTTQTAWHSPAMALTWLIRNTAEYCSQRSWKKCI